MFAIFLSVINRATEENEINNWQHVAIYSSTFSESMIFIIALVTNLIQLHEHVQSKLKIQLLPKSDFNYVPRCGISQWSCFVTVIKRTSNLISHRWNCTLTMTLPLDGPERGLNWQENEEQFSRSIRTFINTDFRLTSKFNGILNWICTTSEAAGGLGSGFNRAA